MSKKDESLKYEMRSTDKITMYAQNPRKIDQLAVAKVKGSIHAFGFINPIIVDKDGVILAGHTRYTAALELGLKEIPVIVAKDLSDAKAKGYRIADNKTAQYSAWDMDLLALELQELDADENLDFNLEMTGFEGEEIDKMLEGALEMEIPADSGESTDLDNKKKITFKLVPEQLSILEDALAKAVEMGAFINPVNDEEDANALIRVCETFIRVANDQAKHYK